MNNFKHDDQFFAPGFSVILKENINFSVQEEVLKKKCQNEKVKQTNIYLWFT